MSAFHRFRTLWVATLLGAGLACASDGGFVDPLLEENSELEVPAEEPLAPSATSEPAPEWVQVDPALADSLRHRVDGFYLRLAHRRFNTVETYNDRIMREYFRDANLFLDYYADLAEALSEAQFEKRRPVEIEILGLDFESEEQAQVRIRFVGGDRRPLRPGSVEFVRVDRWVYDDETWWIQPGKV